MFEKVRNLIASREIKIPAESIAPETNFYLDLGWTSLDMMDCVMDVEDVIGHEIPDDKLNAIQTVSDLVALMEAG